jgi:hypothetical protein
MDDDGRCEEYIGPRLSDYGGLAAMTAATELLYPGMTREQRDLTFSSAHGGTGSVLGTSDTSPTGNDQGTLDAITGTTGGATDSGGAAGAGGAAGGGSGGGSGAAGGKLPFTGLPLVTVGAVGSALVAAGAALRRLARRD